MEQLTKKDFYDAGFVDAKDEIGMFLFEKKLIDSEIIEEYELEEEDIPELLFSKTPTSEGFCIYIGNTFVWFNATDPKDACDFASRINRFESVS